MAWNRLAPFDSKGHLLSYAKSYSADPVEWRNADELFTATMTFTGFSRGRSSALAHFKDEDGRTWPMFLSEATKVFKASMDGSIKGKWCVAKQGSNYSLKLHTLL